MSETKTPLCELFKKYGSDKVSDGRTDRTCHKYSPFYHEFLKNLRDSITNVLEIGIGRAPDRFPGPSLKAWRDFFPQAMIFGADINPKLIFEDSRIRTRLCDHMDGASLSELKESIPDMDLIIEDGLHTLEGNLICLAHLWWKLKDGGIYIIEDVKPESVLVLMKFAMSFGPAELHQFKGKYDDTVIVIWKR